MSRSIVECSGKHWLRATTAWGSLAMIVSLSVDAGAQEALVQSTAIDPQLAIAASSEPETDLRFRLTFLDITKMSLEAFGDSDGEAPASR